MQEHIGVVILLLDETKQKLLLGKRKNAYKSGYYGLPGGRIEIEEPFEQAVKRELKEETNLKVINLYYLGVVRELQKTYNFLHFVFLCESYSGNIMNAEPEKCEGWEWISIDKLPVKMLAGHKAAINLFKKTGHSLLELLDS